MTKLFNYLTKQLKVNPTGAALNPDMYLAQIKTSGGTYIKVPYKIRCSKRAKNLTLSVGWGNFLELTVPHRTSIQRGLAFFKSQHNWIERNFLNTPRRLNLEEYFQRNPYVYLLGEEVDFIIKTVDQASAYLEAKEDPRSKYLGRICCYLNQDESSRNIELVSLLRTLADIFLKERVEQLVKKHGLKSPHRIGIRNQATRWGSCSTSKTISLNWRILLVEPKIQDYIILHELAHLYYLDHSSRYWNFLKTLDPFTEKHDNSLNALAEVLFPLGR